ncbi:MAG: glycerol-3-phosphate responsive antiterminator [Firmicutes bacterium]|nr:glycerol-3-phosphate responsive antiterminator [Bacillota bacterium]
MLRDNKKRLLMDKLAEKPVIAGIREPTTVEIAVSKGMNVFFILGGTLLDLSAMVSAIKAEDGCLALVHIDLIPGIGKDAAGIEYLAQKLPLDGVVTTRTHLIRAAKDVGLLAIQRLFALDSEAVKTGLGMLRSAAPDAVEILPALVLPYLGRRLPVAEMPPIIAGGLVETVQEVRAVLDSPAVAVSTSKAELWGWKGRRPKAII